jgi:predicted small lipoprotein YifL
MRRPIAKTTLMILVICSALAGCGIDGPPKPPAPKPAQDSGITISGNARFGVETRL